ncbi:MAG: histidine phosphatase family protein [Acidobacteria bacterium]|nr:histidine phosphatase family protein [Acidobacteriota bacterium]
MTCLLFIRHGLAEDFRPGAPDSERALTEEGWEGARAAMKALVGKGFTPSRGISSPYRRALETMACLKEAAGAFPVGYSELFTPEEDPADAEAWLLTLMRGAGEDEVLAFTSHQPLLGTLIARMTGRFLDIKQASCTVIEWKGSGWMFRKHFTAAELRGE